MKIALFGASGATGKLLTQRCIHAGYEVTALFRSTPPPHLLFTRPASPGAREPLNFKIVRGSAFDPSPVRQTIAGADIVLSALGANSLKKEDVLERAIPQIIAAMQDTETQAKPVRRIIVLGSAGALSTSLDKQPAWRRWIVQNIVYNTLLKWPVASQISQWNNLSHSSLDWTMVMPPMLTNTPGRGAYRIDGDALPPNGSRISREDVADFMMQQIGSPQWIRKGVYITW
ncbi:NAD(P)-dependent oxidoreductase [Tunturiibacter gelidoferens]|uniref:Putative NADH-flavin reductase n=1 Tax=Tunturiibacter lichenicola TaxID=2051959 RepID=A0A7Y9T7Y4_9BACT|nr:NAD(P)H-binding protein [Edaphobacter lichenicola]NYF50010.1 putative NADH-flavin reductase [Edaphobacter lichenicola]